MFIDRDSESFRSILDYLRTAEDITDEWIVCLLPLASDQFRLQQDAMFYGFHDLAAHLKKLSTKQSAGTHETYQVRCAVVYGC